MFTLQIGIKRPPSDRIDRRCTFFSWTDIFFCDNLFEIIFDWKLSIFREMFQGHWTLVEWEMMGERPKPRRWRCLWKPLNDSCWSQRDLLSTHRESVYCVDIGGTPGLVWSNMYFNPLYCCRGHKNNSLGFNSRKILLNRYLSGVLLYEPIGEDILSEGCLTEIEVKF